MKIICKVIGHNFKIRPHPPMPYSELDKAMLEYGIFPAINLAMVAHYNMKFSYCTRCGVKEY